MQDTLSKPENGSDTQLLALLQQIKSQAPSTRCVVLLSSQVSDRPADWMERTYIAVQETLDDPTASVHRSNDQDVFIFSKHTTTKLYQGLLSHPQLDWLASQEDGKPAAFFEVGYDGDWIGDLIQNKIRKGRDRLANLQMRELEAQLRRREIALNAPIRLDLIKTIEERRRQRAEPHILVVDDDAFTQKLVRKAIPLKLDMTQTDCAAGAMMLYVRAAPDILFLDIGLPDVDGHGVLEKIMEMDPRAYVIMLSGNGSRENVMKAIEKGARGFVGKPFNTAKLMEYIEKSPHIKNKQKKEGV
jgi:two-component system chemotaxis response regulator CheY